MKTDHSFEKETRVQHISPWFDPVHAFVSRKIGTRKCRIPFAFQIFPVYSESKELEIEDKDRKKIRKKNTVKTKQGFGELSISDVTRMVYKKGGVKKKAPVQHTKDDPQPAIFKKKTKQI